MTFPYGPAYGFGLYVHWPYCSRICPYCDFNVYKAKSSHDTSDLVDSIIADIKQHREFLRDHRPLDSVYFGGGTPSLLSATDISKILSSANSAFGLVDNAEITLEANPNDVDANDISDWRSVGINRLSIGLQSIDNRALQFLGRDHTATVGHTSIEKAMSVFDKLSVDLIYALPDQSLSSWQSELNHVLQLGISHLSLYELTFEERTAFGRRLQRGEITQPAEDTRADFYQLTNEMTTAAGLPWYEISNYAKDESSRSIHNKIYWRGGDWIGVGPGAHGRITKGETRFATESQRRPTDYIVRARSVLEQLDNREPLDSEDISNELIIMGLRLREGIELSRLKRTGRDLDVDTVDNLRNEGLVHITNDRIHLTNKGCLLADAIGSRLAI